MIKQFQRVFQVPELKEKIIFTLLMLIVCRIGVFIPVPGVNGEAAELFFRQSTGGGHNLFQLVNMFSGGAFSQMTVAALGVVPYISASIIMQLVIAVFPGMQREMRENPHVGKKKMIKWTRIGTVVLALFQSCLFAKYALQSNLASPGIVVPQILNFTMFGSPILFFLVVMVTMTTGTVFLMWIGEQITERGIGNGISLIITINILSALPSAAMTILRKMNLDSQDAGEITFSTVVVLAAVFVFIIVGTILIIQGQRRIPLQYARRVVGRRETQGGKSFIPLKLNYAGVIPVIFASSILMFPATIAQFAGGGSWLSDFASRWFSPGTSLYITLYVLFIVFFTYFWTATQFNPAQIASDMKKNGAFVPGIRQGKPTQDFLEMTMNRITLLGAVSLALIAILPTIVGRLMNIDPSIAYFFGGTPILILVGVVLDTLQQIDSHLLMKRYDGLVSKGRVRGR
jgi:preprotein translocase subunit SecY